MNNVLASAVVAVKADFAQFNRAMQVGGQAFKGFAQVGQATERAMSVVWQSIVKGAAAAEKDLAKAAQQIGKGFQSGMKKFLGKGNSFGITEMLAGLHKGLNTALDGMDKGLTKVASGIGQALRKNGPDIARGLQVGFSRSFQAIGIAAGTMSNRVLAIMKGMAVGSASALGGLTRAATGVFTGIVSMARSSAARVTQTMRAGLRGAAMGAMMGMGGSLGMLAMAGGPGGMAAAGGMVIAQGIGAAFSGAAHLNETLNKTKVVFGESTASVLKGSQEMADKFGVVKGEYLDASSQIGNLLMDMGGMSQEVAARMTKDLTTAAADLGSVWDKSFGDVATKIAAAMRGMSRPIADLGIDTQLAAVKQEALRMGIVKTNRDLTTQEKIAARASLILRGAKYALGDKARTAKDPMNAVREAKGRFTNLLTDFGASLQPIAVVFLGNVNRMLKGVGEFVSQSKPQIDSFVAKFFEISEYVGWIANEVATALSDLTAKIVAEVTSWDTYKGAVEVVGKSWEWLKGAAAETFEAIGVIFRNWSSIWEETTVRVGGYLTNVGEALAWLLDAAAKFLVWFQNNWKALLVDSLMATLSVIDNIGTNFQNLFLAIADWASGKGWTFNFTPLLEGFKATMEKLPDIARPAFSNVQDRINAIRGERDKAIQEQEDERLRKAQEAKEAKKARPKPFTLGPASTTYFEESSYFGEDGEPEEEAEEEVDAKTKKKQREADDKLENATIRQRRASEDLGEHFKQGGGQFKGLTQFAQDIQSGALNAGDFQRKTLRLQEDLLVAMREAKEAFADREAAYGIAAP